MALCAESMKMRKGEDLDLQDETLWRVQSVTCNLGQKHREAMTAPRSTPLGYLRGV
jgi:hypothetical protein